MKQLLRKIQKVCPPSAKEKTCNNHPRIEEVDNTSDLLDLLENRKYLVKERLLVKYWTRATDSHKEQFIREILARNEAFQFYQSMTIAFVSVFSGAGYRHTGVSLSIEKQLIQQIIKNNLEVEMFDRLIWNILSDYAITDLINSIAEKGMYNALLESCKKHLTAYQIFQYEEAIKKNK